jgi:hypothetical protein
MSDVISMHTSLPGAPNAQIWVHTDWIVVRVGDRISCGHRAWMEPEHATRMATALAEAAS